MRFAGILLVCALAGCSAATADLPADSGADGAASATGGTPGSGGAAGLMQTGGSGGSSTGGAQATGGAIGTGGMATGGTPGTGGATMPVTCDSLGWKPSDYSVCSTQAGSLKRGCLYVRILLASRSADPRA